MYRILKLNEISKEADAVLTQDYQMAKEIESPDAIMLRSFNMHDYEIPDSVLAVARAGAGVNNIPIEKCAQKGVVVFNTPGANANAVKELVICALLLSGRKIIPAIEWTLGLKGKGAEVGPLVEKGKSQFVGSEIVGKKLGVIGLGAIGAQVANAAEHLGMEVIGYDPFISVEAAWSLSRKIKRSTDLNALFRECDFITLHIPYLPATKDTINAEAVSLMKDGVSIINCSRGELVNNDAVLEGIRSGKIARYVTDFPCDELIGQENVVCIPHLGASTPEAEDNCAVMAAQQLMDFVENGNIANSVNFPACSMPRNGRTRLTIIHRNIKDMINKITARISEKNINIDHFINKSKGDYAYTMIDLDDEIPASIVGELEQIDGVIRIRLIH